MNAVLDIWLLHARVPVAVVAVGAVISACGGHDAVSQGPTVELTGCVGLAPTAGTFALWRVRFPEGSAAAAVAGITEHSWVRLEGGTAQLEPLLDAHVSVRGEVIDAGRNTMGTPGAFGYETPSGDHSMAAADIPYPAKEHAEAGRIARQEMANGMAAEIRVTDIERLDQAACHPSPADRD